ncbi:hypothetical protein FPR_01090 [Faecalibacterium prausnitzii SL3/3]|uniref:Uncharacterized protein n=1 Tax=Faecalibacterium prausnitzii SL3/3 TaxID=657322 RepID=D4K6V9_9FIRM|nr:hypothetical protein FPR_01090 [Faecalibacterium prausnitzii SL3/3]
MLEIQSRFTGFVQPAIW